jgi:DNA polymerase-3 subunit delta'
MPFRDIPAHRRIVELLSRSVSQSTLPPSLLFTGPSGSGKRLTAVAVAQALNCLEPRSLASSSDGAKLVDACGVCAACARIARGVHPDVLIVQPGDSGSIKIDQIRDVVDRAAFRPFEGRRRVVIVDDADALVTAAQNALLKTLEEPPPSSVFILITSRPDVLLPTVRSRCIRLTFTERADVDLDREAYDVAQRVLMQVASASDGKRLDSARDLLTGTGGGSAEDRQQVAAHMKAIASLLRDIELIAARADDIKLSNPDARSAAERLVPAYRGERGVRAHAAIDRALEAVQANVGVKVVADWLVLQL